MTWILISVFLALASVFLVYFTVKHHRNKLDPKIKLEYESGEHEKFKIYGKKTSFIISKNNRFDYLVENGQIIACRDKSKSSQFVYYGGYN